MLVLTRNVGESLFIGDNIKVRVLSRKGDQIKIGIDAPRDVNIVREEIAGQPKRADRAANA